MKTRVIAGVIALVGLAFGIPVAKAGLSTNNQAQQLWVMQGSPGLWYQNLGSILEDMGDQNGDHVTDFLTSEYEAFYPSYAPGKVMVVSGKDGSPILTLSQTTMFGFFGQILAGGKAILGNGSDSFAIGRAYSSGPLHFVDVYPSTSSPTPITLPTFYLGGIRLGDVNGDGFADVLVSHYPVPTQTNTVEVYLGPTLTSSFSMTPTQSFSTSAASFSNGPLEDLNADGYADLVMSELYNAPRIYWGSGNNPALSANSQTILATAGGAYVVQAIADLNGDGLRDFAAAVPWASSAKVLIYRGKKDLNPQMSSSQLPWLSITTPLATCSYVEANIVSGDFDGDNVPELVVDCGYSSKVLIYKIDQLAATATLWRTYASSNLSGTDGFGRKTLYGVDSNADGFGELLISAQSTTIGTAYAVGAIYRFTAGGVIQHPDIPSNPVLLTAKHTSGSGTKEAIVIDAGVQHAGHSIVIATATALLTVPQQIGNQLFYLDTTASFRTVTATLNSAGKYTLNLDLNMQASGKPAESVLYMQAAAVTPGATPTVDLSKLIHLVTF